MKVPQLMMVAGVVLLVAIGIVIWTGPGTQMNNTTAQNDSNREDKSLTDSNTNNPIVTIHMESGNEIKIELYPEIAPNTVNNFLSLARSGFYDGTIFHRVIPGFMIQGGDPDGTGMGGPGYSIRGEFTNNGFQNDLKHERGVVSMARTPDPNSAGSQFFIVVGDASHLDRQYAAFGRVISGMDEVDRIVAVPRNATDRPLEDQRMAKVSVEQFGIDYPEPEKIMQ